METNTAEHILACARSLVVRGSYNGFSYADIAEVVGIRKASIHHHFPSKVDLMVELVRRYRADVEAGLAAMEQSMSGPYQRLERYVGVWKACISDGSLPFCVCAMLASELPALPPELAIEVRKHFELLSGWLARVIGQGIVEGALTVGDAKSCAEQLMATVHGAMLAARAYGRPEVFGSIVTPVLERMRA
jgi:TetR/AcrR family transcriptional regulator, transcriptional repressor for nem operon